MSLVHRKNYLFIPTSLYKNLKARIIKSIDMLHGLKWGNKSPKLKRSMEAFSPINSDQISSKEGNTNLLTADVRLRCISTAKPVLTMVMNNDESTILAKRF